MFLEQHNCRARNSSFLHSVQKEVVKNVKIRRECLLREHLTRACSELGNAHGGQTGEEIPGPGRWGQELWGPQPPGRPGGGR